MAFGYTAMVAVCLAPSASSQEYSPLIEDRVDSGLVQAPEVGADSQRRGGWDLGLVVSAAYNDNIFLSSESPESDMVFRVEPQVAFTEGDEARGEGGFVKAGYRPTLVIYAANGDENRVDHQAVAVAGWRGKVTLVTYTGSFKKLGDATAETGQPTTRIEFENEVRCAWMPRKKVALEAAVGNRQSDYSDPGLNDSGEVYGEVAVRYTYSPKTELGIVYQIGRLHVERSADQNTQQLTAEMVWKPSRKVGLNLEAGAEHRDVGAYSEINPVLEGRVSWAPRDGTELYLAGYMREEASAYYQGQNCSVRGVAAGISQRINGVWSAKLDGGYESNTYQQVSGEGSQGRKDRIWFLRPALVCRVNEDSDLLFFYRVSDNDSSASDFGYSQQMLGVEYNQQF